MLDQFKKIKKQLISQTYSCIMYCNGRMQCNIMAQSGTKEPVDESETGK